MEYQWIGVMSVQDILLIISALTTSLLAIMAPIITVILKRIEEKQSLNKIATDSRLDTIHGLVDGSLTTAQNSNASLVKENQNQKEVITRLTSSPQGAEDVNQQLIELRQSVATLKARNETTTT